MLINRLYIQRFRGIRDLIDLDLSFPLTVIYAPNGTGKTSICDAVEWMLSGNVRRIQANSSAEIECRFGNNSTFVEIELLKEIDRVSQTITFKRELQFNGEKCTSAILKKNNNTYKKISDLDLLSEFVPEIATSKRNDQASWIYSTRFLEGDSLSLLIDGDEQALGARKLIFSNLFGVKQYQESEKQLLSILSKLPADSTIQKERKKLQERITELNKEINEISENESTRHYKGALTFLNEIKDKLSLEAIVEEDLNVQDTFKVLEVEFVSLNERLEHKKQALLYIQNNQYRIIDLAKKAEELVGDLKNRNETLLFLKSELIAKTKQQEELFTQFQESKEILSILETSKNWLQNEKHLYEQQWQKYHPLITGSINEQAGFEALFSLTQSTKDRITELISKQTILINPALEQVS